MKLVRMGWESWEVLAVCDHRGRCQVIEFLMVPQLRIEQSRLLRKQYLSAVAKKEEYEHGFRAEQKP